MFEKMRYNIARALTGQKATSKTPIFAGGFQFPGQPVYTDLTLRKAIREGYKWAAPVYAGIRAIVKAGSGVQWIVLDKDGEVLPDHDFTKLINHPNDIFSGQDLMEILIAHLVLCGNALWQPLRVPEKTGIPKEIWPVMPDLVKPVPSTDISRWIDYWKVYKADGSETDKPYETFIHFLQVDPGNPYWGIGDIQAAGRTIDTYNEAQDTQKVNLQNRNVPPGVFKYKEHLDDTQFEEATKRVREKFLQKSKRGEPWILGGDYEWIQMGMTAVEMDYIASQLQNTRAIAAALGIDPWWVGDRENSTYNNVAEARKSIYVDKVVPLWDDIKSTLNQKVRPMYPDGDAITITYDLTNVAALRDDMGKKVDQATKLFAMGASLQDINEVLELGLSEFDGWDTHYLPFNLMPAGSSSVQETPPVKMLTKVLNLTTEEQKAAHWKRIDRRREAYVVAVNKKILSLYKAEGKAVIESITGKPKEKLESAAKTAINSLSDNWEKLFLATSTALVEDFGAETARNLGGKSLNPSEHKWEFNPVTVAIRAWLKKHAAENVTSILDTNLADVRTVIIKGVEDSLTVPQIASKLRDFYADRSTYKAYRVARTEVSSAAGYGQHEAAKQSGVANKKQFISSRDDRVRDSHAAMDGEIRDFDEPYSNGLMYPGDPSGAPEEIINCRCVESYSKE